MKPRKYHCFVLFGIVLAAASLMAVPARAYLTEFEWTKIIPVSEWFGVSKPFFSDVALDSQGNIVTCGGGEYGGQFWAAKFDPTGNLLWFRRAAAHSGDDDAIAVAVDSQDNVIVAGHMWGGAILQKYNPAGTLLWAISTGVGGRMPLVAVAIDSSDNVVVPMGVSGWGPWDTLIRKYDPSGNLLFESAAVQNFYHTSIAIDPNGDIIVGGLAGVGTGGNHDFAWMKLSPTGQLLWRQVLPLAGDDGVDAVVAEGEFIYLAGHSTSFGSATQGWIAKVRSSDGQLVWQRVHGGALHDYFGDIALLPDGGLALIGNPDQGAGNAQVWLMRYSKDGEMLEEVKWGGPLDDFGGDLAVRHGKLVLTGSANGGWPPTYLLLASINVEIQVTIDIKPGSFPNSINPRSRGVIPVAILTTNTFDAATVDSATVRFGATGTEAAPVHAALEDVDGDANTDMILHFNTQDTGIMCGDTSASLTGETFDGQMIKGSDSIKTVGCK